MTTETESDLPGAARASPPQAFLESVSDPVVALDGDWRYAYVNAAAAKLKGRPLHELLGRCIWEVFPEAVGTRFHEVYHRAVRTGRPEVFEAHYAPLQTWYEVRAYPSPDGLWIWFRDTTEQRRAAAAEEGGGYRQLFERSPAALYRTAPDGLLVDVNPALISLLGYPDRATFMEVNAADVYVDREDRKRWRELLEERGQAVFEMRDRRHDGTVIWVRDTATAVRDGAGRVVYYEGVLEDITAEREAEQIAIESEERFRLLARASDDTIWDWNLVEGSVRWNRALKDVFGYDPQSVGPAIEQSYAWWLRRIHPEDRDRVASTLHAAVDGGGLAWTCAYRFRRLDGSYASVHDRGFIGRDEDGQPIRMIGAMLDLDRRGPPLPEPAPAALDGPPVPSTSDGTLVRWVADGDERAFEELYRRHAGTIFSVARGAAGSDEDGEEVVIDVFLSVWGDAATYDPDRGTVTGWLATMARSRALERTRKRRRRARLLAAEQEALPGGAAAVEPDSTAAAITDRILLEDALAGLSDPQRRVLELAYISGHSHAEISARLQEPLGTIKTRIRAGLGRMRDEIAGRGSDEDA